MVDFIQRTYERHLQIGQVGDCARPSAPHDFDRGVAGEDLKPGDGVLYVPATDNWFKPTTDAERKLVTHIVTYNKNSTNQSITSPTTNNITEIVFSAGEMMPLAVFGSFFVLAGETVEDGDAAIYNQTTEKWIKYNPASATPNSLRKKAFEFYPGPGKTVGDGEIVEVRIHSGNYAFPEMDSIDSVTDKISLTAAQIKLLQSTPFELVAAQGADTLIEFQSAMLVLTAGSEVLTETADNMAIEYDDGNAVAVTGAIEATGFIDQAADTITNAIPVGDTIDALADVVNTNIALLNTGDGEYAGNVSNDAALDVYVTYRVLNLA